MYANKKENKRMDYNFTGSLILYEQAANCHCLAGLKEALD